MKICDYLHPFRKPKITKKGRYYSPAFAFLGYFSGFSLIYQITFSHQTAPFFGHYSYLKTPKKALFYYGDSFPKRGKKHHLLEKVSPESFHAPLSSLYLDTKWSFVFFGRGFFSKRGPFSIQNEKHFTRNFFFF